MKILINANVHMGGAIQVAQSLICALQTHHEHEYSIVCSHEVMRNLGDVSRFPPFMKFVVYPHLNFLDKCRRLFGIDHFMDKQVKNFLSEAVLSVFGPTYWKPSVLHVCGYAKPQYIYIESPFFQRLSMPGKIKLWIKKRLHLHSFRRDAHVFITETEEVSRRLRKLFPESSVYTVTNTYNQIFNHPELQEEIKLPEFNGISLLTISALYPHKNLEIIFSVGEYLLTHYPNFKFRFIITLSAKELGLNSVNQYPWILPIGKVSVSQCPSLYRQCNFAFLPTLLECFSANYPEAMKTERPILTSDLPFARDICQDAAEYFDPLDPVSIGDVIYNLANDKEKQKRIISSGQQRLQLFCTPEERTSRYLKIIQKEYKINK